MSVLNLSFPINFSHKYSVSKEHHYREGGLDGGRGFGLNKLLIVFVSIEKIYQTLENVFHCRSKHSNFVKNTSLHAVFSTLLSVFGYPDEILSLVFDILHPAS